MTENEYVMEQKISEQRREIARLRASNENLRLAVGLLGAVLAVIFLIKVIL